MPTRLKFPIAFIDPYISSDYLVDDHVHKPADIATSARQESVGRSVNSSQYGDSISKILSCHCRQIKEHFTSEIDFIKTLVTGMLLE